MEGVGRRAEHNVEGGGEAQQGRTSNNSVVRVAAVTEIPSKTDTKAPMGLRKEIVRSLTAPNIPYSSQDFPSRPLREAGAKVMWPTYRASACSRCAYLARMLSTVRDDALEREPFRQIRYQELQSELLISLQFVNERTKSIGSVKEIQRSP